MTTNRPYRIVRKSPTDLDDAGVPTPSLEFDYRRGSKPGEPSWPLKHGAYKFGPSLICRALASGLIVVAEIEGFPHPVAIKEARWEGQVLEVVTLDGPRIAERIWTRKTMKGLTVGGVLLNDDDE